MNTRTFFSQILIDATSKFPFPPVGLPGSELMEHVRTIWEEVGLAETNAPRARLGAVALGPLRTKAESQGSADFSGLYAGEAAALCRELPAGELTLKLAAEALQRLDAPGRAG